MEVMGGLGKALGSPVFVHGLFYFPRAFPRVKWNRNLLKRRRFLKR
jgi:hypothetical protein